jgi:hypothetical protein
MAQKKDFMTIEVEGQVIQVELVNVTPELAEQWLSRNENNRSKKQGHLSKIMRAIELEEFRFAGDPIRIADTGELLDGQHRLEAVRLTGRSMLMIVMRGFTKEAQLYMDSGKARGPGDQVTLQLGVPGGNNWASVARLIIRWDAEDLLTGILQASNAEVVAFCREYETEMRAAVAAANAQYTKIAGRKPVAGAVHFFANRLDSDLCHKFFRQLATGADLSPGNPVFALRDSLLTRKRSDRFTSNEELSLYVRAWNAARKGQTLQRLQLPRGGLAPYNFVLV